MRNIDPTYGDLKVLRTNMLLWARGFTKSRADAEDLVQATFIQIFANRRSAPADLSQIAPWARVVMRNLFLTERRLVRPNFVGIDRGLARGGESRNAVHGPPAAAPRSRY